MAESTSRRHPSRLNRNERLPPNRRRGVPSLPSPPRRNEVSLRGSSDNSPMTSTETTTAGPPTTTSKRYRLPGIEREGIAQLSLLETALWPLQGGKLPSNKFETAYTFMTAAGKKN